MAKLCLIFFRTRHIFQRNRGVAEIVHIEMPDILWQSEADTKKTACRREKGRLLRVECCYEGSVTLSGAETGWGVALHSLRNCI